MSQTGHQERQAANEWKGYYDFFDHTSSSFYAKIDKNAIYLHATTSGFSDKKSLSDIFAQERMRNYIMDNTDLDETNVDAYIADDLIKYGVTMLLESYEGLERFGSFFESSVVNFQLEFYDNYHSISAWCAPDSIMAGSSIPLCQYALNFLPTETPLILENVHISELLMTPIGNFIEPNSWAKYLPECGI